MNYPTDDKALMWLTMSKVGLLMAIAPFLYAALVSSTLAGLVGTASLFAIMFGMTVWGFSWGRYFQYVD